MNPGIHMSQAPFQTEILRICVRLPDSPVNTPADISVQLPNLWVTGDLVPSRGRVPVDSSHDLTNGEGWLLGPSEMYLRKERSGQTVWSRVMVPQDVTFELLLDSTGCRN